jgi:steroid 5-alpha reductase family enzyme
VSGAKERGAAAGALVLLAYVIALVAAVAVGRTLEGEHSLWVIAGADLTGTLVIFAFSRAFDNSSFYDAYWSVAPVAIAGYLVLGPGEGVGVPVRQALVLGLVVAWSARLTHNWWRQWRGLRHEDWRYVDLRRKHRRAYWAVSLSGIHLFPTVLVYLGCLALWPSLTSPRPLGVLDGVAIVLGLAAVSIEALADRQLHRFVRSGPAAEQLLETGLWAWCRNPNYLGEIGFWVALSLFGTAGDPGMPWIWSGPAGMLLLFVFISIPMKERRMLARRPAFADRKREVPMLLPLGRRRPG